MQFWFYSLVKKARPHETKRCQSVRPVTFASVHGERPGTYLREEFWRRRPETKEMTQLPALQYPLQYQGNRHPEKADAKLYNIAMVRSKGYCPRVARSDNEASFYRQMSVRSSRQAYNSNKLRASVHTKIGN